MGSLAAWPVVSGFVFTLRSAGFANNEVVVALLDRPGALAPLRRFSLMLAAITTVLMALVAATPLGELWLGRVAALPAALIALSHGALWALVPLPGLNALQSLRQGVIVHSRATRAVTESVALYLAATAAVLGLGVLLQRPPGLWVAAAASTTGAAAQVAWLWWRARDPVRALAAAPAA
jgi:hypothetical protein